MANRVLVVDDDLLNRKLLKEMLTFAGWKVKLAVNGEEALDLIEKEKIDVILSDYEMYPVNGLELHQIIKEKGIPFILMSGSLDAKNKAKELGIVFLEKPFMFQNLLKIFSEL